MVLAEGSGLFTSIGDLPLHPLVVHFAVTILPLAAIGLVLIVLKPSWRKGFGWVVLAGLLVGAGAAFVAKESGEALATYTGLPREHADYGNYLPIVAVLLFLCAAGWFFSARKGSDRSVLTVTLAVASVVLAVAATILTIVVGHTGAQAAWAGTLSKQQGTSTGATAPSTSTSTASAAPAAGAITMADVAKHSTPQDCWSAVNGNAYDLTQWISQHPGGAGAIESMCGIDASSAFTAQHGGQNRPERELATFLLGPVSG